MSQFQRAIMSIALGFIVILFAFGFGQASGEHAAARKANAHPKTVTKTVDHTVTVTKTNTVTVDVVPDACTKLIAINADMYHQYTIFAGAYGATPDMLDEAFLAIGKQDAQALQDVKVRYRAADEAAVDALNAINNDLRQAQILSTSCTKEVSK